MLQTVSHVVGPFVQIGDRVVQRCALCGEKLADTKEPDRLGRVVVWNEGLLVRCQNGIMFKVGDLLNNDELPDDFCLPLVEYGRKRH